MIKGITQTGKYMQVMSGHPSSFLNIPQYTYQNNPVVGSVRFTSTNDLEVYDGMTWRTLGTSFASVGLSPEAEMLLDWAKQKMREEHELEKLAKENETIKDLVNQLNEKKNQIAMVKTLIKKDTQEWHEGMTTVAMQTP